MLPSLLISAALLGADDLVRQAADALEKRRPEQAAALATRAVEADPKNSRAHLILGAAHEMSQHHRRAIAAFSQAIRLDPKLAAAYNHRGSERFKLGQVAESIADFDAYLALEPKEVPGHWKRGISYYYAGRYKDGAEQFARYEKIDTNDVENAVWRYLCMARDVGVDKARAAMLKVGKDARVPFMEIYDLYLGKRKPADVLAAAMAGKPSGDQLNERLFYAHLYLGLYYDSLGDFRQARPELAEAVEKHRIDHYMWDVGRVHLNRLRKQGS